VGPAPVFPQQMEQRITSYLVGDPPPQVAQFESSSGSSATRSEP
jgi:hypothetical protein